MPSDQRTSGSNFPWRVIAGSAVAAIAGATAYAVGARSSQVFGPSVYRGPGKRHSIALTFDDGPSEGTLRLLDYLNEKNARATFFQCGMNVLRHPKIARAVQNAGHEIANHTYSHPRLPFQSPASIDREFARAQDIIAAETGAKPKLVRVPYGLNWYGMGAAQRKLGLLAVSWTVIGRDWKWPASRVADRILKAASPGGIICLHDGRAVQPNPDISETLHALHLIIPALQDQGYNFETVSEILLP